MLVDCSTCRTPLQLPPGAKSIRCALCHAVTRIADPRGVPPPPVPQPPYSTTSAYHHHHHQNPPPPLPSPYNHAPPGQPPSAHGRKRAVICGISYKNSRHELKGCVNDANCMKHLLVNRFKFPESSIIMLTGNFLHLTICYYIRILTTFPCSPWVDCLLNFKCFLRFLYIDSFLEEFC